ncbi:MAG TPA: LLM class F420-dependent oxidoreductase [Micromonosporaceae bacterium]|jgi:probable F420-dependent oxidoreductase
MEIGVVFPQTEIGADPAVVRAYAAAVEELGYRHILAYDHVLGADPTVHRGWKGPYDIDSTFHEPFVLFGYLAAITELELITGIVILPQRQTALVAKQAAQVDILSQGRLRLGVGLGWNRVEYEALGKRFDDRGRRLTEQVELLRLLWTRRSVTLKGEYETVTGAGLAPMPVQRPIPIWFGAQSEAAYRRAGRLADGWFPQMQPGPALDDATAAVRAGAFAVGRNPDSLGMHGHTRLSAGVEATAQAVLRWRETGASHLSIDTMGLVAGSAVGIDRHLSALAELAGAIALPGRVIS